MKNTTTPNRLIHEKSPYLLQHAYNPVDWYPWCAKAFERAKTEDKPVFLSIGYSTCHWCHVMSHESFENSEVAELLNKNFISIKVDKEERPDIDSIYMNVCQALTGSGGWPTTIFMAYNQKPFFAGTYFPTQSRYGLIGFVDLLSNISEQWNNNKDELLQSGNEITKLLEEKLVKTDVSTKLLTDAVRSFQNMFDKKYGGFGSAPKFPTPHNLMFLMNYYEKTKENEVLKMVEKTLVQMYKGGIFDHIGYGFSRYSTDKYFLAPHFEKMLYDNALLIISYIQAYSITGNDLYKKVAEKTASYVLRELTHPQGGFYCAQDADSDGVEGKYYVFEYNEIIKLLGDEVGEKFNQYYGITKGGNFEGKSIPNLLNQTELSDSFEQYIPKIYEYRKTRTKIHLDDKILTSWNGMMIAAFAMLFRVLKNEKYLLAAQNACDFIEKNLAEGDSLFVSFREGKVSKNGFLDDYAFYIFALINMYEVTLDDHYLKRAVALNRVVLEKYHDANKGGFYLYGQDNEKLILKPKETYDGAIPSGNSVMAFNLIKLATLTEEENLERIVKQQMEFMGANAEHYQMGHSFYLIALIMYLYPMKEVICVLKNPEDRSELIGNFAFDVNIKILDKETNEYKLLNNETTFYICENRTCKPPTNNWKEVIG